MACFRTRWLLIFVGAAAAGAMATAAARQGRFQAANTARHAMRARDAELTREQGALMTPPDWDAPVDSDVVVIVPSLLAVDAPDSVLTGRDGGGCDDDEEDGQEAAWQHGEELLADADVPMAPPLATAHDPAPMAEALASNGVRRAILDSLTRLRGYPHPRCCAAARRNAGGGGGDHLAGEGGAGGGRRGR